MALTVAINVVAAAGPELSKAYREEVITPHWEWVDQHAGGTLKVLFITSFLGEREPEELAQRFDLTIDIVPSRANPSAITDSYDEAYLTRALAAKPDVIFVSFRGAWNALSPEGQQALADAVAAGTPLIALSAGGAPEQLLGEKLAEIEREGEAEAERNLAFSRLQFPWGRDEGRIGLSVYRCGEGRYINVGMGHGAGGRFNSFVLTGDDAPATPPDYEIAYAMFARLIRWAAGKDSATRCDLRWEDTPTLGSPLSVMASIPAPGDLPATVVEWELRSSYGDALGHGAETIPAGKTEAPISLPLNATGELTLLYRLRQNGAVTDFGAIPVRVASPVSITGVHVPAFNAAAAAVPVEWSIEGEGAQAVAFLLQVYDVDGRLVAWTRQPTGAREGRLDGWQPQSISHRLHLLVLDAAGNVLAEARAPLNVQLDRSLDPSRFHVMAWSTEFGDTQEQWRYRRMRQLGITALSPIGKNLGVAEMAAASGLRLAPVNVCVPPSRFKKEFSPSKEREALAAYSKAMAPLSPLGYSLADEPSGVDLAAFRNWTAEIIHANDPGALIGYCGTHMKVGMNIPQVLADCDFMIHYSPHYLYTSNLWRGIERDLHRAFTKPGAINSAYTHYVPWADHEPYSRTTPWLLLFEEANGISYFASAGGNFSILGSDLRTTHETRWWSEEIHELQQGVATQLIAMRRDPGNIALLFPTDVPEPLLGSATGSATLWAETLREMDLPFTFVARGQLDSLDPDAARLLICPTEPVFSKGELAALQRYVEGGGVLVATAPFALFEPQPPEEEPPPFWETEPVPAPKPKVVEPKLTLEVEETKDDDALADLLGGEALEEAPAKVEVEVLEKKAKPLTVEALFGIHRPGASTLTRDELVDSIAMRARIPARVTWPAGPGGEAMALAGSTAGQYGLIATDAEVVATFQEPDADAPQFAREALASPAAFRVRRGKGSAYYLNMLPDPNAAATLLRRFQADAGGMSAPARVLVDGAPAPGVYLYPMVGGGVRMLGIIQDYERVKPAFTNDVAETAIYYHHGPQRWAERTATLELPEPVHLYDVRSKRYLGKVSSVEFQLQPGRPALFAMLPYKVAEVVVETASTVKAGDALQVQLRIATESGDCGDHTVHVRFSPKGAPDAPGFASDVVLVGGRGAVTVPTAFNDPQAEWGLQVTDVLSGERADVAVRVESPGDLGPVLPRQEVKVETVALDWPQGEWTPYVDAETTTLAAVEVNVNKIQRKRITYGPFNGMECLMAKRFIRLQGRKSNYQFSYMANNDWEKKGWKDKRRVETHSLSGLGMNDPAGHLWYYNGYIDIYFDDVRVTGYQIADVNEVSAGENGRVDVTWQSPEGEAVLSFGLTLDGDALLQQLVVRPTVPVKTVKVRFRSYIGGFGQSDTRFVRTPAGKNARITTPTEAPWAFYADDVNDQAYGKGMGAGGILILPEEWDRVQYGLTGELEKAVNLEPGQSTAFHWALWVYPKLTNEEAFDAFTEDRRAAETNLRTIFKQ